jgi:putative transposase
MLIEQVVPEDKPASEVETASAALAKPAAKRRAGRPKGSRNQDKTEIEWTEEMRRLERMAKQVLGWIGGLFPITYLVLDGHFGHNNVLQVVRQCLGLHLISKLRHDSALYFQYEGPQKQFGPRRRYGPRINYQALPDAYRVESTVEKKIRTDIYQAPMLHKCFAQPLNVVIIVKTHLQTGARAHVVLFSSDLSLSYDRLILYYRLRFQIEFNFRDAKQFWGLEDFMNVNPTPVTNAANLALFMVLVSQCLLQDFRLDFPLAGVLDLKAFFRGRRYALATLELLPEQPAPNLIHRIIHQVARLGAIHPAPEPFSSP